MSDFTTLGEDKNLKIKVPVKGATNWGDTMKSDTFQKIADHDHSGVNGKGTKLSTIGKDSEDTFIDGKNKIHMQKAVRFVPTTAGEIDNPAIGDMYVDGNGVLNIFTKTGQACSLTEYGDEATCEANGGTWTEGTWETASATTSVQGCADTQFTVDTGAGTDIGQDQLLYWDNTAGQKKFKPIDRVSSSLNDIDTSGVTDGDLMVYDGATSKWKPESRAGEIIMWAKAGSAPKNALECNGQEISEAAYPELYNILGTTYNTGGEQEGNRRVPDYRNVFFRGSGGIKDNGGGTRDPGHTQDGKTAVNGLQASSSSDPAVTNISIEVDARKRQDDGQVTTIGSSNYRVNPWQQATATVNDPGHSHGVSTSLTGDDETRPANMAIAYYIRYK